MPLSFPSSVSATCVSSSVFTTVNLENPCKAYKILAASAGNSRTPSQPGRSHISVSDQSSLNNSVTKHLNCYRPCSTDLVPKPTHRNHEKFHTHDKEDAKRDYIWSKMRAETCTVVKQEPILSSYYFTSIVAHDSLESALAHHLAIKLSNPTRLCIPSMRFLSAFLTKIKNLWKP